MLRIGDFSKLSQVSIKTLRYYDELGLLKPIYTERLTGYRYYSVSQLPRLNRILALKDLGFSLDQIAQILDEGLSKEQIHGMLLLRSAELQHHIATEQARLARVEARLNEIDQENALLHYDVVLKHVDPQLVAGRRTFLPNYIAIGHLFEEVYNHLIHFDIDGATLTGAAIWHNDEYEAAQIDGEAVVYLKQPVLLEKPIKVYKLAATTMASTIHKGAYNTFRQAYKAIGKWIETNGYKTAGPPREIYLYCTQPVRQDDDSYVTEIQFPIVEIEIENQ
jgi:DNA-binding transcriptional MerR regulator